MKKTLLITALLIFALSFSVYAHPPAEIEMNFKTENKMLEVTIAHSSADNKDHFIKNVAVYLNDNLQIEQNFIVQTNNKNQYLHYMIPGAKSSDVIKLKAECSKYGSKEQQLTIK